MTYFFKKIFIAPGIALRWVRSLDFASKGDYQSALQQLEKIDQHFSGKKAEYHLLKGFLCYATSADQAAIENLEMAIRLIGLSHRYQEEDKRYLICYANPLLRKAKSKLAQENLSIGLSPSDCDNIDLSSVKKHLKKNFPLRDHPNWIELS